MELSKLIDTSNKESIGKHYLSKGVSFAIKKEFGKSYEFFKEGIDLLTCDCPRGGWLDPYKNVGKALFDDLNIRHESHLEYYFVKAYILSYENDLKELYLSLDAIDRYLENKNDGYGQYVKGKILLALEKPQEAINCFNNAYSFTNHHILQYRIGRTKEQFLEEYGLGDLFLSFLNNNTSVCCARNLKEYSKRKGIILENNDDPNNMLINAFLIEEDEWDFQYFFEELIEDRLGNNLSPYDKSNTIIFSYIKWIIANSDCFLEEDLGDSEADYDDYRYNHPYSSSHSNPYYNDSLDMDQQSPEFWDNL
ncbi:tetratricopeptide (TPR) repeat protein [Algoriphagus sp. 4150]|uniref:hypothetical protein n=1 Tax=Algoriphagus sp. 4150 TaxID=2817756 RepID=UPI0028654E22|nr:hypothetical protein [Algoriphagus sp. 4150]MDR7131368.1 tetratricopeptide (TPR) repeat protein [Algoriphagus sp. 4150]